MPEKNELNLDNLSDVTGGATAAKRSNLAFDFSLGDHVEIHTKKVLWHQRTSGGTIKKRAYCRNVAGTEFFDGYYVDCGNEWSGWYSGNELKSGSTTWSKFDEKLIYSIKDQT